MMARVLLAVAALLLALGGSSHLAAYRKAVAAVAASNLADYFGNALKALWLMDSAGMFALAVACVIAARPAMASGVVVAILGTIPAATAILLYVFIGPFVGAHILAVTAAAMIAAGALRL